jgi:hypothetical protein
VKVGSQTLAVASLLSPAASLLTQQFDPYILLEVFINIPTQSISGIPILQFNGDTGTTAYAYSVTNGTSLAGVVTLAGATGIAGAANGIFLAQVNTVNPVVSKLIIGNGPSQAHTLMFNGLSGVVDASAAPSIITGSGVWSNTSRITSVQLISSGGGNLGVGTGIFVIGTNP